MNFSKFDSFFLLAASSLFQTEGGWKNVRKNQIAALKYFIKKRN